MKPHIEVIVLPTGDISIDAVGFNGADCEKATRFIEETLGKIEARNRKPEFGRKAAVQRQQKAGA